MEKASPSSVPSSFSDVKLIPREQSNHRINEPFTPNSNLKVIIQQLDMTFNIFSDSSQGDRGECYQVEQKPVSLFLEISFRRFFVSTGFPLLFFSRRVTGTEVICIPYVEFNLPPSNRAFYFKSKQWSMTYTEIWSRHPFVIIEKIQSGGYPVI